jgi:hypothetical protein
MTTEQEAHLSSVQNAFYKRCDTKYRKGQAEHGGDLFTRTPLELLDMAIDEAVDQVVYLITLKQSLTARKDMDEL